jgi:hypothetical protein
MMYTSSESRVTTTTDVSLKPPEKTMNKEKAMINKHGEINLV